MAEQQPIPLLSSALVYMATNIPKEMQMRFLKAASEVLITGEADDTEIIQDCILAFGLAAEDVTDVLGVFVWLLQAFMESNEKQFTEKLQAAGFDSNFIKNIPLQHKDDDSPNQVPFLSTAASNSASKMLPKVFKFNWRVDISLADGPLNEAGDKIVISMKLNNENSQSFTIDMNAFQNLRHSIAESCSEFFEVNRSYKYKDANN